MTLQLWLKVNLMNHDQENTNVLAEVVAVLNSEADAIRDVAARINESVSQAIDLILKCQGRVIVTGMGKMGCIARKATATFCSTGTPAVFLHPSEAVHGDLGIVTEKDVLVVLSKSGETRELVELLPFMARLGIPVIALTGNLSSSLATRSQVVVDVAVDHEADSIAVAPTNSTTVALAMCDALAVALMNRRGFTKEQFAIFHPGGSLGAKLLIKVSDLMRQGDKVPVMQDQDSLLKDGIKVISDKGVGAVFVVSSDQKVVGIVTDGDLRRIIQSADDGLQWNVWVDPLSKYMSSKPKTIRDDALAAEAMKLMEKFEITVLPVVDQDDRLTGIIHLHDLVKAGLA